MEKLRLEKEEKAKKDAKKAALNSRLAAFGGKSKADEEKERKEKEEAENCPHAVGVAVWW